MSATIFNQLLVCAVTIAMQLFLLESTKLISFDTVISVYFIFVFTTTAFIYCSLSETVTTDLLSIGDNFYDFAWYLLPVQQQRFFLLPIQRAYREFHFGGLGLIDCSLKNFLSVKSPLSSIQSCIEITKSSYSCVCCVLCLICR